MTKLTPGEALDLQQCMDELEGILERLDTIGAGIAAIYVDAAIHQLSTNIGTIDEAVPEHGDPSGLWAVTPSFSMH